ncbi:MAG: aldo/keto reductase [Deltaproteobacteria bacterium]|nr:MAG: aldo/keto reductase [Deltaproteobacteria bacterium]
MAPIDNNWSRRDFLKAAGAAGVGSFIAPIECLAESSDEPRVMPTRAFGKTGVSVPILGFGGSMDVQQLMLRQASKWGVTYWDTANSYYGGNSERQIGKYLGKYPEDRKKIFLVTKSHAWTVDGMTRDLNTSLERMKTDYIDLFFVHSVRDINELNDDIKGWSQKTKAVGKIRFFGFSTHSNMEKCMQEGATLGWIDGIMMSYNYRLMHTDHMKRAVDACAKAGIGLTAMKTQGGGSVRTTTKTEVELAGQFLENGFTDAQAKLKAVWENPNIASICSEMPNMTILMANVAAAYNRTKLSIQDLKLLRHYAQETGSDYCAGCTDLCETTIRSDVPIGDVMRYLMYCSSYGDRYRATMHFNEIPETIRRAMARLDYSLAEKKCPQGMAIGKLMREAVDEMTIGDRKIT